MAEPLTMHRLAEAIRALIVVIEMGSINSAQRQAIHEVRRALRDVTGSGCRHENTAYEQDDVLVCQVCREVVEVLV